MWYRTLKMVECGLKPVYVFEGKPPTLKSGVVRGAVRVLVDSWPRATSGRGAIFPPHCSTPLPAAREAQGGEGGGVQGAGAGEGDG
jgi:hypothetical protein